jgi:putative MATE family efflux protein
MRKGHPLGVNRYAPILRLGAPLIAFFLVQQLANLIGVAFYGHLGDAALAGVGAAGAILGVVMALLFGFDTGAQALISRAVGAGSPSRPGEVLADTLAGAIPLGALLAVGLWAFGPTVLAILIHDKAALAAGSAFLRASAPQLLFLAVTTPINAGWIASGRPGVAFLVTVITATAQVGFTWLLVFGVGPIAAEGAAGVGMAGTLDTLLGLCLQIFLALRLRLVPRWAAPSLAGTLEVVAIGWPVSVQQSLVQFFLIIIFFIVAQLGVAQAAVLNVLVSLTLAPIQTMTGFGVAAATLVGQSLGRGEVDAARRWGWRSAGVGVLVTAPMGLVAVLAPGPLLGLFLHDPATLALAILPTRIAGLAVGLDAAGRILGFAFRGAGATKIAAGVPFASQWLIQVPLMWWVALRLGAGVTGVVAVQTGVVFADAALFAALWSGGLWTRGRPAAAADLADVPPDARRIAILGGGGAGKSTLARRLGAARGLPVIHLDRLVFGPGWTRLGAEAVRQRLTAALPDDAWIVEGTYAEASELTLPRADLVLWIDQPTWLRMWRSWRKTRDHQGRPRADRPEGCAEGFGWRYAVIVLRYGRLSKSWERGLDALSRTPVVRLRGDRAIARLLGEDVR